MLAPALPIQTKVFRSWIRWMYEPRSPILPVFAAHLGRADETKTQRAQPTKPGTGKMAHCLRITEDGRAEMFSGRGINPWHGLGSVVDGMLKSLDAIQAAHLGWRVLQRAISSAGRFRAWTIKFRGAASPPPLSILRAIQTSTRHRV